MARAERQRRSIQRFIRAALLALAAAVHGVGNSQTVPERTTPVDSPFPEITGVQWLKLQGSGGRTFLTAILRPEGPGPFPVVVVLHGSNGLTRDYLSVAQDIARAGFVVVYGCWQAGEAQSDGNRLCSEATPQSEWVVDPKAHCGKELIAFAKKLPGARADRVGLFGLSRGGHAALWAASTGAVVQAVVVDAPAHAPNITPAPPKPMEVLPGLAAPLLMMHGTADNVIPVEQSRDYERAAVALGKPLVVVYFEGIGHMATVQPESQAEARKRTVVFLREQLLR